jgi:hypothetical protein
MSNNSLKKEISTDNKVSIDKSKRPNFNNKNKSPLSTADRYKLAWTKKLNSLQSWRRSEITRTISEKTFGIQEYDKEFIRSVISLAESNDSLN